MDRHRHRTVRPVAWQRGMLVRLGPPLTGHGVGWHLPRRSLRVRLALACWGVFVVTGVPLLAVTVGLWQATTSSSRSESGSHAAPGQGLPANLAGQQHSVSVVQHSFDLHQLLAVSGIALVIMAVPAVVAGWLVAGRLLRPLRAMTTDQIQRDTVALPVSADQMQ